MSTQSFAADFFARLDEDETLVARRVKVVLPADKVAHALATAKARNRKEASFGAMTYGGKLGGVEAHNLGILGEAAVAYVTGQGIDERIFDSHGDEGIDITLKGKNLGVKTTTYPSDPYLRVEVEHFSEEIDAYVLCYINEKADMSKDVEVVIIGWATRDEVRAAEKRSLKIGGRYGPLNYILYERNLRPWGSDR